MVETRKSVITLFPTVCRTLDRQRTVLIRKLRVIRGQKPRAFQTTDFTDISDESRASGAVAPTDINRHQHFLSRCFQQTVASNMSLASEVWLF